MSLLPKFKSLMRRKPLKRTEFKRKEPKLKREAAQPHKVEKAMPKRDNGKDPAYLSAIHDLPCVICHHFGEPQMSITQAHHTICGRGSNRRTPDRQAIPLCEGHHQGDFDTTKTPIHRQRAEWVRKYGPDTDWIAWTQEQIG